MIERTPADINFRNSTRDYKEITLNPAAKFLGNSETLERKVSVWRIRGEIYVTDVKYVLDVWGYPMGLRDAPSGIVQQFKGRDAVEWVLYGIPKGETERYKEQLLLTNATPALIEKVKALAAKDGFHSFRVAKIDLSKPPDFSKVIKNK